MATRALIVAGSLVTGILATIVATTEGCGLEVAGTFAGDAGGGASSGANADGSSGSTGSSDASGSMGSSGSTTSSSGGPTDAALPDAGGECPPGCASCSDDGTCNIDCTTRNCSNVECPPGRPCRVGCEKEKACDGTRIECAAGQRCTVSCKGKDGCNSTEIEANGALSLCVQCEGDPGCNSTSCDTGNAQCNLHCATGNACNSACGNCTKSTGTTCPP